MDIRKLAAIACIAVLTACTSVSDDAKEALAAPIDCRTAEQDIALLESERASTAEQVGAGIRTVTPIGAVGALLRGDMQDRASVTTGEYNQMIDFKIADIRRACGL